MAKRPVPLYDFKAFGAAITAARNEYVESRKKVSDELYISPRYLANIENKGCLLYTSLNSVSAETGLKYHPDKNEIQRLRDYSDNLCRKYGLSVVIPKQPKVKKMSAREYRSADKGPVSYTHLTDDSFLCFGVKGLLDTNKRLKDVKYNYCSKPNRM